MDKPDLLLFPDTPGVYLFKDASGKIIYVGKARRLRRRIASYFRSESLLSSKTRLMMLQAHSLDTLLTGTEKEALLLEAGLIKKHRPRYNIVLRDDKEYLLFRLSGKHPFPRLEIIRKPKSGGRIEGKTFGPYSSGTAVRETWRLIYKNFPLRRCRDAAFANRTRPCLYHHMGQCLGPCVLPVSQDDYKAMVHKVEMLLGGRSRELLDALKEDMLRASDALEFEKAARLRDQLRAVEHIVERQSVSLAGNVDMDILGIAQPPGGLALGVVFVRGGLLLDGRSFFWPGLAVEDIPELLQSFLTQYYVRGGAAVPPRIVVPWLPQDDEEEGLLIHTLEQALAEVRGGSVRVVPPKGRDEDSLMLMATANALDAAKKNAAPPMAELLAARLHAPVPLRRIECVDISHTSGRQTRAGMVVFEDGEPLKEAWRAYILDHSSFGDGEPPSHEAPGPGDDYAALAAWAARRAASGPPYADMVLVDGGKGQLAAVQRAFEEAGLSGRFCLASIAKARDDEGRADRRAGNVADRIFLPGRSNPLSIRPGSAELLFLQRVRDAAHDFVLGRHRRARTAAALSGELARLPGVGPKLARALFERFGSIAAMAAAGETELKTVPGVGAQRAALLRRRLAALTGRESGEN